ncbi:retropepsin-like aspartic protease [Tenacibaculum finnmarkense]|uniref:retropepsin-like aspartic protease n=1 Tax=Tenacibaculum finnmarkense TaxID=2781243 RepID=UPI001EFBED57|nr:retropepsin-like aspartic protease [Tenacibaculum finnmarkense]MCG8748678.1 hypothetical protein [Tenacibaculum finnmarkense]MCG8753426.1 hypothetical protein [Tenacibaculum finnmarkense]MCG8782331.1 hypothetical protein [Tenacibaculum finnmarkense]
MNKLFAITLLFFFTQIISAQNINKHQKIADTTIKAINNNQDTDTINLLANKKNDKNIIEIPFELAGKLIAVDLLLNGTKRKFILDTGAPFVILNSAYIIADTTKTSSTSIKGVNGNISSISFKKTKSINFSGLKMNNQDIMTMNLAHLEKSLDYKFYGLIGYDLIKEYDIMFDYRKKIITLINPDIFDDYKKHNLLNNSLETIPVKLNKHIPVVDVKINNKILKLGIDSGASSNLIDNDLFSNLKKEIRKIKTDKLEGADKHSQQVKKGKIKKVRIGNKLFKRVKTSFSDISHLNRDPNINIDGLIGYPILSKQRTLISFLRKEIIFIK